MDSKGNTIDFLLTAKRDTNAAKRFFIKASHTQEPIVINVVKIPDSFPIPSLVILDSRLF